jgi:hypothetical protein
VSESPGYGVHLAPAWEGVSDRIGRKPILTRGVRPDIQTLQRLSGSDQGIE